MRRRRPNFVIVFVTAALTVGSLAAFMGRHHYRHHSYHGCSSEREMRCESHGKSKQQFAEPTEKSIEKDSIDKL